MKLRFLLAPVLACDISTNASALEEYGRMFEPTNARVVFPIRNTVGIGHLYDAGDSCYLKKNALVSLVEKSGDINTGVARVKYESLLPHLRRPYCPGRAIVEITQRQWMAAKNNMGRYLYEYVAPQLKLPGASQ